VRSVNYENEDYSRIKYRIFESKQANQRGVPIDEFRFPIRRGSDREASHPGSFRHLGI